MQLSLPDEKGEPRAQSDRWKPDELLVKAQERLELLLKLAPTAERYALLGSYYKRRAITLRGDETARNKALGDAEAAYGVAENWPEVADKVYHTLNRLACRCLRDMDLSLMRIASAWPTLRPSRKRCRQSRKRGLSFWERIVRPDAALGRILLNLAQGQIEHDEVPCLRSIAGNSRSAPPLASAPPCWSSCSSPL